MLACKLIYESHDSTLVKELFHNIYDGHISHNLRYKGMSVYQVKVATLRRISGIAPPRKIDYRVDSTVVEFYRKLFKIDGL